MTANRFEQAARERQEQATSLRSAYLPDVPADLADRTFGLAYEQGHAHGWSEVENHYCELAPLVQAAFDAGKAVS